MSSPCRNGATCALVGPNRQFRCICPAGFTGDQCQSEIQGKGEVVVKQYFYTSELCYFKKTPLFNSMRWHS